MAVAVAVASRFQDFKQETKVVKIHAHQVVVVAEVVVVAHHRDCLSRECCC